MMLRRGPTLCVGLCIATIGALGGSSASLASSPTSSHLSPAVHGTNPPILTPAQRKAPSTAPGNWQVGQRSNPSIVLHKSRKGFSVTPAEKPHPAFKGVPSSSPNAAPDMTVHHIVGGGAAWPPGHDPTLTFSEYPTNTTITNQYESDGILFSGDSEDSNFAPYITSDGAQPTTPVLTGGIGYGSDIVGEFVVPGTTTPAVVDGFSVDVGYIDTANSTHVEVFGPAGQLLGSIATSSTGIDDITSHYADISYFLITGSDPSGWTIDNLSYTAGSASGVAPVAVGKVLSAVHSTSCQSGNYPVDCASGDFWHTFNDVSVPVRGPALDLTRTYNSLQAGTEGMFGYGWSSSYGTNLVVDSNADCSALGDANGCVTITEADGSQVTANPTGGGGFTVPSWADSTLSESGGNYTFVRQATQTFTYNSSGQLTAIADPNGYDETLTYNSPSPGSGNCPSAATSCETIAAASGQSVTLGWSGSGDTGTVTSATDPSGNETTYVYSSGDLTSVTDPDANLTSFTYGTGAAAHLLLTMSLPNGQSGGPDAGDHLTNTYDSYGRVLTQTDPAGLETTYTYSGDPSANYSSSGGTTTITDPHGNVTVEDYLNGQLQSKTEGSSTWTYGFDQSTFGETSMLDPDGHSTTSTYDASGNLLTSTDALGNTTTYTYNSLNEPLTIIDPESIETAYTYDGDGNVETKVVTGLGELTHGDHRLHLWGWSRR